MHRMYEEQMEKNEEKSKVDMVNHPPHYTEGSKEVIEMMEDIWGPETVANYCEINAFKYRMRAGKKNSPIEDLDKAKWYENKAKELKDPSRLVEEDTAEVIRKRVEFEYNAGIEFRTFQDWFTIDGVWYHCVTTWDDSVVTRYVDGVEQPSRP